MSLEGRDHCKCFLKGSARQFILWTRNVFALNTKHLSNQFKTSPPNASVLLCLWFTRLSNICAPFPYSSEWKTLSPCSPVGWLREIRRNPNAWWWELCFLEHIAKTAAGWGSPGDNTLLAAVGNSGNSGEQSTSGWMPTWVLPEAGDFTGRLIRKWWGWGRMGKMSFWAYLPILLRWE